MKIRTLSQTIRTRTGKVLRAAVRDQAGGAEFVALTDDGTVRYSVTIETDGSVYLKVTSDDAVVEPFAGYAYTTRAA
jgi:hypothetical protein